MTVLSDLNNKSVKTFDQIKIRAFRPCSVDESYRDLKMPP